MFNVNIIVLRLFLVFILRPINTKHFSCTSSTSDMCLMTLCCIHLFFLYTSTNIHITFHFTSHTSLIQEVNSVFSMAKTSRYNPASLNPIHAREMPPPQKKTGGRRLPLRKASPKEIANPSKDDAVVTSRKAPPELLPPDPNNDAVSSRKSPP